MQVLDMRTTRYTPPADFFLIFRSAAHWSPTARRPRRWAALGTLLPRGLEDFQKTPQGTVFWTNESTWKVRRDLQASNMGGRPGGAPCRGEGETQSYVRACGRALTCSTARSGHKEPHPTLRGASSPVKLAPSAGTCCKSPTVHIQKDSASRQHTVHSQACAP